jgi:hypothetical protein
MTEPAKGNLFRPDVAPSKGGGLLIIGRDGSRVQIPDCEVESFLDDCQHVRNRQLRAECAEICAPLRFPGVA